VHVTHFKPGDALRPELLLQADLAKIGPIIRGEEVPHGPYAGRQLDYSRDAVGMLVPGALARESIWKMELQVATFENDQRGQRVVLFVGNGNQWANDGFVSWIGCLDRQRRGVSRFGLLAPPEFDLRVGPYPSFVVWRYRPPTVEPVTYYPGTRGPDGFQRDARFEAAGANAGDILWATSGQHVVRGGRPIDHAELVGMACAGEFYDLNHLFRFPWVRVANIINGPFVQVGYRSLLDYAAGKAHISAVAVEAALLGNPMDVDIGKEAWGDQCGFPDSATFDAALVKNLEDAGYEAVPSPTAIGEYAIVGRTLRICFLPGHYPHSLVGSSKQGRVVLIQVTYPRGGKMVGNRSAMTILGTARAAVDAANRSLAPCNDKLLDALLIDNGGDVMLWQREPNGGWEHTVESELHRDALRSVIAVVADADAKLPHPGIRHEVHVDVAAVLGAKWEPLADGSVLVV
jgi:hypothetical protein